jgi:N-acyl-D-aspartate/D-glutamate deacylase
MLDLKIANGTIVDGTGKPGFTGDLGIRDGRIVAIGQIDEEARETIDATGRVVAPGFIDCHTHYDAQVFWDPTLSPSCYHGVTTVFGGFCGFSIAPLSADSGDYLKPMLARVEGMPLEVLDKAVPWNWSSFGEFLDRFDGKVGLNAGFFAGHSAIRRYVMGARAVGEKANEADLEAMKALLGQCLAEGAMGFSTTVSNTHNDGDGNPVPSRWAEHSEIVALAGVVKDHEGTGLELLPDLEFGPGMPELLADVSIAGNRPVNWNVLGVSNRPDAEAMVARRLAVSDFARERGGEVIALTTPVSATAYMNLRSGFLFDAFPGIWPDLFRMSLDDRMAKFRDPAVRRQMVADLDTMSPEAPLRGLARLDNFIVSSAVSDGNQRYVGRKTGDIAREEGREPIDVMLDIALADNLDTVFTPDNNSDNARTFAIRGKVYKDDRTLIGASDAGAHLDLIDTFAFSTGLLQQAVREFGVISLEEAVHQITGRQATYFGLIERGLLAPGYHADIVVFDKDTIGRGPTQLRYDLPGGNDFRLYADAEGIDHVFVNGVEIVRHGQHTGKLPGKVLRSGTDTKTVAIDAMRETREAA